MSQVLTYLLTNSNQNCNGYPLLARAVVSQSRAEQSKEAKINKLTGCF